MSYNREKIKKAMEYYIVLKNDVYKAYNSKGKYSWYLLIRKPATAFYISCMISVIQKLHRGRKKYTDMLKVIVPGWGYGTFVCVCVSGGVPAVLYFSHFAYVFYFCKQKEQSWLLFLKYPGPSTVWDHCCHLPSSKADNQGLPRVGDPFGPWAKIKTSFQTWCIWLISWNSFTGKGRGGKRGRSTPYF